MVKQQILQQAGVGDGMMVHASSGNKAVVETPIVEYNGLRLRGVRRVVAVDSASVLDPEHPQP